MFVYLSVLPIQMHMFLIRNFMLSGEKYNPHCSYTFLILKSVKLFEYRKQIKNQK